ncbi:MAG: A/G-specific adenine glycosylase [Chlamydiae bacterium CG10_big_fil_rev_8_21_14_0_10_35_9]|nr:MAG: A/G-specific adenine glycosylase [Chlamydiae bacterium CG10_big_fil_rev_8_21_14_0_10_35_9]
MINKLELQALKKWFFNNKRKFSFRENPTPYSVWISEVMLQQTRASVVVSYFNRWMQLFPDIESLAKANISQVMKAWEGLGYYSRAKRLHIAANELVEKHKAKIPDDPQVLKTITGIGPYTVGAILSFAFRKKAPAVDANVIRVITRFFGIEMEVSKSEAKKLIEDKTLLFLEDEKPYVVMEALIELGALVCQKKPICSTCPLKENCKANRENKAEYLPLKKEKKSTVPITRMVFILQYGEEFLIFQEKKELMNGLYQFPYINSEYVIESELHSWLKEKEISYQEVERLASVKQFFTNFKVMIYPFLIRVTKKVSVSDMQWIAYSKMKTLAFCSGHRRIINQLKDIS